MFEETPNLSSEGAKLSTKEKEKYLETRYMGVGAGQETGEGRKKGRL